MLAQISAALTAGNGEGRPRVLVFGCQWSGHAAAELAGARDLQYPADVRLIPVRCSARFDPIHILWALLNGAAGVFLGACPPGECHYLDGNRHAEERIVTLKEMLAKSGFDARRLRLEWITPDDPEAFVNLISDFAAFIAALEGWAVNLAKGKEPFVRG
jgi:coenzyme F420-reducing hydrogenase delta subunit